MREMTMKEAEEWQDYRDYVYEHSYSQLLDRFHEWSLSRGDKSDLCPENCVQLRYASMGMFILDTFNKGIFRWRPSVDPDTTSTSDFLVEEDIFNATMALIRSHKE